jgi:parallel beta-helix repeat protein
MMTVKIYFVLPCLFLWCGWLCAQEGAANPGAVARAATTPILGNNTDQTEAIQKQFEEIGRVGEIKLPAGMIGVSAKLFRIEPGKRITLRGAGRGLTIVKVLKDVEGPLVESVGETGKLCSYLTVEDVTFLGDDNVVDGFHLERTMWANFTRVEFRGFKGTAIRGVEFWDSVFQDCFFIDCGDAAKDKPAVQLASHDEKDVFTSSNNISFLGCRWESNPYVSLRLDTGTRKVRVVSCKFHGTLPKAQPYEHIVLNNADSNAITATNFSNGGKSAIGLVKSHGNVIAENLIGSNPEYGVHLLDSHSNSVSLNSFAVAREQPNVKGAILEEGESKINKFEGNVGAQRGIAGTEEGEIGKVVAGSGIPEGKVSGEPGTVYLNTQSGATVKLYLKFGGSGKNGWKPLK